MTVADAANDTTTDMTIETPVSAATHSRSSHSRLGEVHAAVEVLAQVDLSRCGHADLAHLRGASQRLRGFTAAADARIARRSQELVDESLGGGDGPGRGDRSAGGETDRADDVPTERDADDIGDSDPLGGGGANGADGFGGTTDRRSSEDAERDTLRGRAGAVLPSFEAALEAGEVDAAHVDAVAIALQRLDDAAVRAEFVAEHERLLAYARVENPRRFRRRCQDLARRLLREHGRDEARRSKQLARIRQWWDDRAGIGHLHVTLDPESWAKLDEALQSHLATVLARDENRGRDFDEVRVDAFVELVTASSAIDARVPEISVLVDWETLRTGAFGETGLAEAASSVPLTPEAVRRLACDARILPVVLGGDGVPLDVGRSRRLATPAQRRAIAAMYRTCAHPECSRPISWCQIHHVAWWELGGPTDLGNMVPLCDRHHHQVHEGGWTLTIDADRVLTWISPSGTVRFSGNTCDRPPVDWDRTSTSTVPAGAASGAVSGAPGAPISAGSIVTIDPSTSSSVGSSPPRCEMDATDGLTDGPTDGPIGVADATGVADTPRRRRSRHARRPGTTLFDHDREPAGP